MSARPSLCATVAIAAFVWALRTAAADSDADISVQAPRAFGYTIGDVLTETVHVVTGPGVRLDDTTLPRPGRIDAWLEIRAVAVASEAHGDGRGYEVRVEYQIANSPRELKTIALPALTLGIVGPRGRSTRSVGDVPVNVGPITTDLVRVGLEEMRSDVPIEPFPTAPARSALTRDAAMAAVCAVIYAFLRFRLGRRGSSRPFAGACAELGRLRRSPGDGDVADALRIVHRAFDAEAGGTLFADGLEQFLAERRVPETLKQRTREFFARSRRTFFEAPETATDAQPELAALATLCRDWRRAAGSRS